MTVIRPTWTKTCRVCEIEFKTQSNRRVTCSTACYQWSRQHPGEPRPPQNPCPVCGGPVGKRAGTLYCSARCRVAAEKRRNGRGIKPGGREYQIFTECQHCGASLTGRRAGTMFCSAVCDIRERTSPGSYSKRAARRCEYCGDQLDATERINRRYCSEPCQVKANQDAQRARRRQVPTERFTRLEIFERDQWICHLCDEPVDPALKGKHPMSASLDHLIPLAVPGSPGHIRANVALAHLRCNISKRGWVRPEDWELHRKLAAALGIPANLPIGKAVRRWCKNRLHNLTEPGNLRIGKKGERICVPCWDSRVARTRKRAA